MKEASRKTAVTLFILRCFRLLVSVATLSASAHFFGVGLERESWILGLNFVVIVQLALWGPLNETFRAKFIFIRASEGEAAALGRTASLLLFSLSIMAGIVVLMECCAGPLAGWIAPSFDSMEQARLALLLRYLLWSAILSQATQLLSSVLNTYNSFYIPELSGFIAAVINLALIVLLSETIGIYSLLLANYASVLLLLGALLYQIRKLGIPLFRQKAVFSWQQVRPFILYALPFFLPYLLGQCNSFVEKLIANLMQHNTVAIIDYSRKIPDIIQAVLTSVLATLMVPVLSSKFSEAKPDALAEESDKYLRLVFLMLAFIVPMLVLCSDALTRILYDRGSIGGQELSDISMLIRLYGLSLTGICAYLVFGLILLSVNRSRQYALYGMVAQLIMIAINLAAYHYWGRYTFVIALSVSHSISAVFLFCQLPLAKRALLRSILQYSLIILLAILSGSLLNSLVYHPQHSWAQLIYNGIICGTLIAGMALVLKLPEVSLLKSILLKSRS